MEAGHDMLKATGHVFAYLPDILGRTDPSIAQLWELQAANRRHMGLRTSCLAADVREGGCWRKCWRVGFEAKRL